MVLALSIFLVMWAIISTVVIVLAMRDFKRRFGEVPSGPEEWIIACMPLILVSGAITTPLWGIVMLAAGFTINV